MTRRAATGVGLIVIHTYSIVVVLALWEAASRSHLVSAQLAPSIEQISGQLWQFIVSGDLAFHATITLKRAFAGFFGAVACGIVFGTLMARLRVVEMLFEPIFSFGYPIPKIALYPIFVVVLGFSDASKIALVFLECLYPITIQTYYGMRSAERVLVWAARNMGADARTLFWRVLVPSAAPAIFSGIRMALPVALVVTIITEIIGESRGLGYVVSFQSASFNSAAAFAALFVLGIIGFAFDRAMVLLRRRLIHWERDASPPS